MRELLISNLEREQRIQVKGNTDFIDKCYQNFTIDDARILKSEHEKKPVSAEGKKIFIVTMNGITVEAQNALLKLLEEPADYAHFFIIIPSAHLLLPTVKSRLSLLEIKDDRNLVRHDEVESTKIISEFTKASVSKRMEIIKNLIDDISKEKKVKQEAIDFLDNLEHFIYERDGVQKGKPILEALNLARKYAGDRSPSFKMLLEYVALNV